jgi:predicted nucleic acid-binding protein
MKYCLDSNFFITAWQKYYSPEIPKDFWGWLAKLANNKEIFVPAEVYEEIEVGKDNLYKWIKSIKSYIVYSMDIKVQGILCEIMNRSEAVKLVDSNKKDNASDVFVVAYAQRNNATVVSNDMGVKNLCTACNINILKDYEFLKEKKLKMRIY